MSKSQHPAQAKELSLTGFLGSPRLAQVVMVILGLVFVALVPLGLWGLGSGEAAHHVVVRSGLMLAIYALLGVALAICMERRLRGVSRRIGFEPKPRKRPGHESVVSPDIFDAEAARSALAKAGYRHIAIGEGWAWGVKRRFSPLSTTLLHFAVLLGIAALVLAAIPGLQKMNHLKIVEGGAVVSTGMGGSLQVDSLSVRGGDGGTLARLEAVVQSASGWSHRVSPDMPTFIGPITTAVIEDYDLAPSFSLMPTNTPTVLAKKTAPLGLRRNQAIDHMRLGASRFGEYRITLRLDSKGEHLRARVERKQGGLWRLLYFDREITAGQVLNVGRARLRYDGMHRWALLRIHRSPQIPLVLITLVAGVLGACGRLLFPRCEATVASFEEGSLVTVSVDAYKGSRSASASLAVALHRSRS